MDAQRGIAKGMTVYSGNGEKLGRVVDVDDAGLFVEKGLFFPKEFGFSYADVAEVRDDSVVLRPSKEEISSAMVKGDQGLARKRPSAASESRVPSAATAAGPEARAGHGAVHVGPHVIGTGTDSSLLVDQAEPIVDEVEEEVAIAGRRVPDKGKP